MDRKIIVGLVLFIIILLIMNFMGVFHSLNYLFPQNPDVSCTVDDDCKLSVSEEWTTCRVCRSCESFDISDEKVISINKDWKPFCPFSHSVLLACRACLGGITDAEATSAKCIDNTCQKVLD